ncbi:3-oxoacyl-[acyl-carrier-protein] synthase III C-terminal domain-containing protein [Gordonia humi]
MDPRGAGRLTRVIAAFDEDAVTMSVAAVQAALERCGAVPAAGDRLVFVTSSPPYLDKTSASIVHAALSLDRGVAADDAIGTARSAMAAISSALHGRPTVVAAADVRTGRPGSADERGGADAGAALVIGPSTPQTPVIAEHLGGVSLTEEFLDRWRSPDTAYGSTWEERFGRSRYEPLIAEAVAATLDAAGLPDADYAVLTCPNAAVTKAAGAIVKRAVSTVGAPTGFAGAVDPILSLAHALDRAEPGQTILVISAADGVDTMLLRTTDALPTRRQREPIAAAAAASGRSVPYPTYLSWRGLLDVEPPRRPEPDRPAGPPAAREAGWKFGLSGSRCTACGFVHLPPMRACRQCGTIDQMEPAPVAARRGRVATFTVDRLAYSPSPPVVDVVVDFEGGGRSTFEVADARPDLLEVGAPVDLVFRKLFTAGGVHNYFWKARQVADLAGEERS